MKICNLYCGIGGNRLLWGDTHEITAVEHDPKIAEIYQDHFPNDKVIITDAHQYLLDHFEEFDFIWSSPPCQSHSKPAWAGAKAKGGGFNYRPKYPDMKLYAEIFLLQGYFDGKYCVENVVSWHKPLLEPQEISKHYFWTNFYIPPIPTQDRGHDYSIDDLMKVKGFDLNKYRGVEKRLLLRNCVEPELGKYILDRVKVENGVVVENIEQPRLWG